MNKHFKETVNLVKNYYNSRVEITDNKRLTDDDIYIVWFCYILGGWKALASTTVSDGMHYEIIFNKDTQEYYLDAYEKRETYCVAKEVI